MFQYSYSGDSLSPGPFSVWVRHEGFHREIARVVDELDAMKLVRTLEALEHIRASRQAEDNA